MLVRNRLAHELPRKYEIDMDTLLELEDLERRAHLVRPDREMKPLSKDERARYQAHALARKLSKVPMFNGFEFPFTKAGEPGSAYFVRDNVAEHLAREWPEALEMLEDEEIAKLKGIVPKAVDPYGLRAPSGQRQKPPSMWDLSKNPSVIATEKRA